MKPLFQLLIVFIGLTINVPSFSNVILPAIFSDHMVLQQNDKVKIWGWAKPNEEVSITTSWDNVTVTTKANNQAMWETLLSTPTAGGPYSITLKGYNEIILEDILIGEVWLCSGQSNMEWSTGAGIDNGEQAIKAANYPDIRFFSVGHKTAGAPQIDLAGEWKACTPETMKSFSAIGYFFGKKLNDHLNVPIGLINSSWGGTPAEVWVDAEEIQKNEELSEAANILQEVQWGPVKPGKAYNAMIAPLIPFKIAGALWYQGESNTGNPHTYSKLLTTLIRNWRHAWGYDFPFYYVQIAPFKYGRPQEGALVRDQQRLVLKEANTGMVVISDIGNIEDIHPKNKIDVGVRLANWALTKTYGKSGMPVSGPLFKDFKIEKNKIRLYFDYAENGLLVKGEELTHFEIAGNDQNFVAATASIDPKTNTIVVRAKEVKEPVAVRFAWNNTAEPNLYNKEGLPASTFRTDDWDIDIK